MAKLNLQEQIKVTNDRKPYADENYDDLILTNRASRSSGNISLLSLNKLIEYKDEAFEKIAGRPQPFRSYTKKDLDSLAKSIADYGVIDPITSKAVGQKIDTLSKVGFKAGVEISENSDTIETMPSSESEISPPAQTQSPPVSESYNPSAVSPSKPEKDISNLPEEPSTEPLKGTNNPVVTTNPTEPTESPKSETQPKPSIDINTYIEYVLACIEDRELTYDAGTTACWDNPIIVGTNDAIVRRDINNRFDWYQIQGFTTFAVWAEERTDGKYDLYIGYA